jgi:hypothetical protein
MNKWYIVFSYKNKVFTFPKWKFKGAVALSHHFDLFIDRLLYIRIIKV